MIYYVATTGDDGNAGTSRASPLRTIRAAFALVVPGDRIRLAPGTYAERQVVAVDGDVIGGYIVIEKDPDVDGEAIVDGSTVSAEDGEGQACVFSLLGRSYLWFRNLTIKNHGETWAPGAYWAIVGILIGPSVYTADGIGSHHIRITGCTFTAIDRTTYLLSYALPIIVYSHGDERVSDPWSASTHHIEIRRNTFHDCEMAMLGASPPATSIFHSFIEMAGNVQHWIVEDNEFYEFTYDYSTPIQLGGNNSPTAYPNRPRKGVWRNNNCHDLPDGYGYYVTGCQDLLVERNTYRHCGFAVGIATETGGAGNPAGSNSARIWIRNELAIESINCDLVLGAWDNTYYDVEDIWVTTCAFVRHTWAGESTDPASSNASIFLLGQHAGQDGVTGDSRIWNNLIVCPEWLMLCNTANRIAGLLDRNLWCSPRELPFEMDAVDYGFPYDADQDTNGELQTLVEVVSTLGGKLTPEAMRARAVELDATVGPRSAPSWYYPGIFGDYEREAP